MRILLLHADYIKWEPVKKAISSAEVVEKKVYESKECLVVMSAVEKDDEGKEKEIAKKTVHEVVDIFYKVGAKEIVIYPYVHLTSNPSKPKTALDTIKNIENSLIEKNIKVKRAPFGWYKKFVLSCKGHPLSELSRHIKIEEIKKTIPIALKKERELKSKWFIVKQDGGMIEIERSGNTITGFDFSKYEKLFKLAKYEMAKDRRVKEEPVHIKLMRKLELVDYEPASDPGHFRFLPKGKIIKELIELWIAKKMSEYGAFEVETPIMYDINHPTLQSYLNRFPARQYQIETPNKKVFLRFAACFGQFLITKDANLSYRNLPFRIYELTRYSFRVEQRGELAGLRRLRAFTMPDCHAICKDIEEAKEEIKRRFLLAKELLEGIGLKIEDFEFSVRIVKNFYKKNKKFLKEIAQLIGKPFLLEMWDERFFYFVFKLEWNFIDNNEKAACLATDQIDIENAERYGINYMDRNNIFKHPVILHLSPTGSIERVLYALLEKYAAQIKNGKNPTFELWLSPIQVRIIPVSEKFVEKAIEIAKKFRCVRVDVDDRNESVQKRIRDAEIEWIPLIVVLGQKEIESNKLAVRFRKTGNIVRMSKKEIEEYIWNQTKNFPFIDLKFPMLLSNRPLFIGIK